MLVARSLSTVMEGNGVKLQVMNTGPMPIMLYKGMKIASLIPRQNIMFVGEGKFLERVTMSTATPKFNLEGTNLSGDEKRKLMKLLEEFKESFAEGKLGKTSSVKHSIKTHGPPIRQPIRRLPVSLKSTVQKEVQKMLQDGVIRPSTSPWSSPIVMVRKKDGAWRFCIDFRKLNDVTHKDAYPLPRIDETLESLSGSTLSQL